MAKEKANPPETSEDEYSEWNKRFSEREEEVDPAPKEEELDDFPTVEDVLKIFEESKRICEKYGLPTISEEDILGKKSDEKKKKKP